MPHEDPFGGLFYFAIVTGRSITAAAKCMTGQENRVSCSAEVKEKAAVGGRRPKQVREAHLLMFENYA
jgi:hypothetical protein